MIYDKDIREPLFMYLEELIGKVRFFEEIRTGEAVADVVMVTEDGLTGIEIKSDADTYTRLAGQVTNYDKFYDMNIVVVGTTHAQHIEEHVPGYWGIITAEKDEDGEMDFYMLRKPQQNPNMEIASKLSLLWRPELANIQELNSLPRYPGKSKLFVREKIIEKVPKETLKRQISEELFERDYSAILDKINEYRQSKGLKKRRKTKNKLPRKRGRMTSSGRQLCADRSGT